MPSPRLFLSRFYRNNFYIPGILKLDPDNFCLSDHLPHLCLAMIDVYNSRLAVQVNRRNSADTSHRGRYPHHVTICNTILFLHLPDGFLPVLPLQALQATVPGMFLHGKAVVFWNRYSESVDMLPCPCLTPHGNLCIPEVRNIPWLSL